MHPDGMEMTPEGLITWTPLEGILSSGYISVVVWDTDNPQAGINYPGIQEFQISVTPVNDSPTIISDPLSNAVEDEEYSYQVEANDIDSNDFLFNLSDAPEGMTINQYGLITWTPLEGILSSGLFTIYVYDDNDFGWNAIFTQRSIRSCKS